MAANEKLEERVVRVETTLNALKIAASVLGLTGGVILLGLVFVFNKATEANKAALDANKAALDAKDIAGKASTKVSTEKDRALATIRREAEVQKSAIEKEFSDGVTSGIFKVEPNLSACTEESHNNCPDRFDLKCPAGKVLVHLRNFGGFNTCIFYWKCCDLVLRKNA